ncbi:molybdenum cofactor biosynthesis protein B [Marinicella sp. S1101]|uniref:molybdenum cofactor biosynthesis protein B n=1 Tax=Marinicella marina TaxID=2996016 RepID=UPI0022609B19|nr:molybdenum cofactor biosynthesis protein B [Marinicella marina]MCX7552486.1 molybdenum cofactor biosynthesis protein B [Marinicella marina]MDJ1139362.1 molybdenum cofactor biosynthesis protein B [Marinicella marina]
MTITTLNIAILTVSDTRTEETDTSGLTLKNCAEAGGHVVVEKMIVKDDLFHIRAVVSAWIHQADVNVILITGGTGFASRDVTPDAIEPLLVQKIPGFGELFRQVSYDEIGNSTIQSRATAGIANRTFVAALPGSTGACKTAWKNILSDQLDSNHKPCNFVQLIN